MLHSNFTQNRSGLWDFPSSLCCCFFPGLIYSMMRFHESFSTGTRQDNAVWSLQRTNRSLDTHRGAGRPPPSTPELRPVDSSRRKQIKWSWESTVPVWKLGGGGLFFCWKTKMQICTFFSRIQQTRDWGFSNVLLRHLTRVDMQLLRYARRSPRYCTGLIVIEKQNTDM